MGPASQAHASNRSAFLFAFRRDTRFREFRGFAVSWFRGFVLSWFSWFRGFRERSSRLGVFVVAFVIAIAV